MSSPLFGQRVGRSSYTQQETAEESLDLKLILLFTKMEPLSPLFGSSGLLLITNWLKLKKSAET